MTSEEIKDLVQLYPERFDSREHAALCWVRETLTRREGASNETVERFEQSFDKRHRMYIIATMKSMYFFNLTGNTLDDWVRRLLRRPGYDPQNACSI